MLQIKGVSKRYKTGDLIQTALDNVNLSLRDNEFVAVLGPSGSGKTTLLNVIGGLDRYDSGDLIINSISTKEYKDRDWDSYRNHTIGFVFQSYNLIPHQTILSNVELALTISGISKADRKKRATEALEKVGLGEQLHKKPNQMSGGQMQRVAIARALVNDPDILLADEPTGALDTETSVQVMNLLKEVASDKLVVMVTHNPELAQEYATRIVKLRDGKILDDSDPFVIDESKLAEPKHENMGKSSMSFLTSLSLSFNNLKTKKGRTLLTSFAGSIGIIGIALILSLSNGVNNYITNIQKSTMTSYPISIEKETFDMSGLMTANTSTDLASATHDKDAVYSNSSDMEMQSTMTSSVTKNNLTEFKKYIDDKDSEIHDYVGENGITFSYDTKYDVYTRDSEDTLVNIDGTTLSEAAKLDVNVDGMAMSNGNFTSEFDEILPGTGDDKVSKVVKDNYDVLYGEWPDNYDEVMLVLNENNELSMTTLYQIGYLPVSEYKDIIEKMDNGDKIDIEEQNFTYEDMCKKEFTIVPVCEYYEKNSKGTYDSIKDDKEKLGDLVDKSLKLKITGVIRPKEDAENANINGAIGYLNDLTNYIIDETNNNALVKAQIEDEETNVLNGMSFKPKNDDAKVKDAVAYVKGMSNPDKADFFSQLMQYGAMQGTVDSQQVAAMQNMTEAQLAEACDQYLEEPDKEIMLMIYESEISSGTYDEILGELGVVDVDAPSAINIYADSFEDKDSISDCINKYNETVDEEDKIVYTDYVGLLMSSITTIINVISYVLIAFVAVSLIVSSIMIGIITYISVLERTKEIGILRAIGASKHNISQVFNAETFIIGLCSGVIGIVITLLTLIPGNLIIHLVTKSKDVSASLPVFGAVILILLSVLLTWIGGFIPSKKAALKDPVTALRTE